MAGKSDIDEQPILFRISRSFPFRVRPRDFSCFIQVHGNGSTKGFGNVRQRVALRIALARYARKLKGERRIATPFFWTEQDTTFVRTLKKANVNAGTVGYGYRRVHSRPPPSASSPEAPVSSRTSIRSEPIGSPSVSNSKAWTPALLHGNLGSRTINSLFCSGSSFCIVNSPSKETLLSSKSTNRSVNGTQPLTSARLM